ncbi:MAG: AbrB/MazE/SpoVT family DNA-binding domain-containing protein [Candidatus Eremiobacteraeota bacterium]|nr:AbrB/MazE/SpoVT family DNA-binding domain-containing protein [Candidatus Eremiobacteraeota bacterium]
MRIKIRKLGNSKGIILPKPIISQLNLDSDVEMSVEDSSIVLRKPASAVRQGWAEDSRRLHELGGDKLIWPEFPNSGDDELVW